MKKIYKLAELTFRIVTPFYFSEEEKYREFSVPEGQVRDIDFTITFKPVSEPMAYGQAYVSFGEVNYYKTENKIIEEYCEVASKRPFRWLEMPYQSSDWTCWYLQGKEELFQYISLIFRHIGLNMMLNDKKALIFHCSFVRIEEVGILFSGPSGIGKSTQAELWRKVKGFSIINGDRAILGKKERNWHAYGLPYAGSSNICKNESAKIGAIIVLKQGKTNCVKIIQKIDAYRAIVSEIFQTRWDSRLLLNTLDMAEELINEVPIFQLECTPDTDAVECLYKRLQEENIIE